MSLEVRVLAFARLRELLGFSLRSVVLEPGATLDTLWERMIAEVPDAAPLRSSTRFARNGVLADGTTALADGDEVALMPPVGGG